ncbi:MAG: cyclase [Dehalococcoidia bacterium]
MASMFIRHRVADYARWKAAFDEHEATRKEYGFTGHSLHRDGQDANVIIIAFRVAGLDRATEFARSLSLREAMEQAGVQGAPEIWFAEDIEEKQY